MFGINVLSTEVLWRLCHRAQCIKKTTKSSACGCMSGVGSKHNIRRCTTHFLMYYIAITRIAVFRPWRHPSRSFRI